MLKLLITVDVNDSDYCTSVIDCGIRENYLILTSCINKLRPIVTTGNFTGGRFIPLDSECDCGDPLNTFKSAGFTEEELEFFSMEVWGNLKVPDEYREYIHTIIDIRLIHDQGSLIKDE